MRTRSYLSMFADIKDLSTIVARPHGPPVDNRLENLTFCFLSNRPSQTQNFAGRKPGPGDVVCGQP
jgi:hypothetical protein